MPHLNLRVRMVVSWLTIAFASAAVQADDGLPFVIGFERFGRHAEIDPQLAGQALLTELNCTACHAAAGALQPKSGPSLKGVGLRVQPQWLNKFLRAPQAAHPGTSMPDMLAAIAEADRDAAAQALVAYLSSLQEPFPTLAANGANPVPLEFHNRGDADVGQELFHTVGCVACHEPDAAYEVPSTAASDLDKMLEELDPEELKELGLSSSARHAPSIPQPVLAEKYSRESLCYFLLDPTHYRPASRMPSLKLKPVEAADIAAYLIPTTEAVRPPSANRNEIATGAQLFRQLRCGNCHEVDRPQTQASRYPVNRLILDSQKSCVVAANTPVQSLVVGQPKYRLDDAQVAALRAALAAPNGSIDELALKMLQLNCFACHDRDGLGGVDRTRKAYFETVNHVDIGDEGRLPPMLTGVGSRLQPAWMATVLKGEGVVRPHMTIRMPVYGAALVTKMPTSFSQADHGHKPLPTPVSPKYSTADLISGGRQLMDLGCVQCHSFNGRALPGVVGVDLVDVDKRVDANWLHQFLRDPGALKPRTRMPTFFPEGVSQSNEILAGDVDAQIAGMVAYLKDLRNQPLPAKIEEARAQSYVLNPVDRPVIIRTFMPTVGLHAIAVGFPEQRHFAFDAAACALVEVWQHKFLDAESTWFDRFAKPAEPLGDQRVVLGGECSFAVLSNVKQPWPDKSHSSSLANFRGYKLDSNGVPTFLYQIGGIEISDRIIAVDDPDRGVGLIRSLELQVVDGGVVSQVYLRALQGKKMIATAQPPNGSRGSLTNDQGLTVTLLTEMPFGQSRLTSRGMDWIIPVSVSPETATKIELFYQW